MNPGPDPDFGLDPDIDPYFCPHPEPDLDLIITIHSAGGVPSGPGAAVAAEAGAALTAIAGAIVAGGALAKSIDGDADGPAISDRGSGMALDPWSRRPVMHETELHRPGVETWLGLFDAAEEGLRRRNASLCTVTTCCTYILTEPANC